VLCHYYQIDHESSKNNYQQSAKQREHGLSISSSKLEVEMGGKWISTFCADRQLHKEHHSTYYHPIGAQKMCVQSVSHQPIRQAFFSILHPTSDSIEVSLAQHVHLLQAKYQGLHRFLHPVKWRK
jgi:hypothetical protein